MQRQLSSPANDDRLDALPQRPPRHRHPAPPCLNLTFTQLPLHLTKTEERRVELKQWLFLKGPLHFDSFIVFCRGSRGVSWWYGGRGHRGHRSSFELQINQGPLSGSFHSVQGHPDYTRLKCVFECVCMQRDLRWRGGRWAGGCP